MPMFRIECRLQKQAEHRIENKIVRIPARNAEDAVRKFEEQYKHYHIARMTDITNMEGKC